MNSVNTKKLFALIDCNNFFVSCERVFRPDLEKGPVVILSSNDGCVISRSNEAKALGIPMGVPLFKCQDLIDRFNVKVFSSNFALYGDFSARVMKILESFGSDLEIYSIDEAFLELDKVHIPNIEKYAAEIKDKIFKNTGIPVSVGVASTKTLAKLANRFSKKNVQYKNILTLSEENTDKILAQTEVVGIWGVGNRWANKLGQNAIYTALDLKKSNTVILKKLMGITGERIYWELNGVSCLPISLEHKTKRGIMSSRSFGTKVTSLKELSEAVSLYTERAAASLRKEKATARIVSVFLSSSKHSPVMYRAFANTVLNECSSYTPDLIDASITALKTIYKPEVIYKKAGILLSGIFPEGSLQMALERAKAEPLSTKIDFKKKENLMLSIDKINQKNGSPKIFYGSEGIKKRWKDKRQNLSPLYTTDWTQLKEVK